MLVTVTYIHTHYPPHITTTTTAAAAGPGTITTIIVIIIIMIMTITTTVTKTTTIHHALVKDRFYLKTVGLNCAFSDHHIHNHEYSYHIL